MKIWDKFAPANDLMCGASNESNNPGVAVPLPLASGAFPSNVKASVLFHPDQLQIT